jgi:hypothetical protein
MTDTRSGKSFGEGVSRMNENSLAVINIHNLNGGLGRPLRHALHWLGSSQAKAKADLPLGTSMNL